MSGTKAGGVKARNTNYENYGKDFYKIIGRLGGRAVCSKPKGFAANPELARKAGAIGGRISKRGKTREVKFEDERVNYQCY